MEAVLQRGFVSVRRLNAAGAHRADIDLMILAVRCLTADHFGYNVARMEYEIILAPEAVADLRNLKARVRATVRDAIQKHLQRQPTKLSRSRIKRLRGLSRPQFRLRVDDVRVFYDVTETTVEILAIVAKEQAETWLRKAGKPDEKSSSQ